MMRRQFPIFTLFSVAILNIQKKKGRARVLI